MLLSQYTNMCMIMDILDPDDFKHIQNLLNYFILYNQIYKNSGKPKSPWIKNEVMYGETSKGGFNMIRVEELFIALKAGWIRRLDKRS